LLLLLYLYCFRQSSNRDSCQTLFVSITLGNENIRHAMSYSNKAIATLVFLIISLVLPRQFYAQSVQDSIAAEASIDSLELLFQGDNIPFAKQKTKSLMASFEADSYWLFFYKAVRVWYDYEAANSNHTGAINLIDSSLILFPESEKGIYGRMQSLLGFSYNEIGELFPSLNNYEAALSSFVQENDTAWMAYLFGNLGINYIMLGDYEKAIDYCSESVFLYQSMNSIGNVLGNYQNLSEAYFYKGAIDEAEAITNKQVAIYDPEDGSVEMTRARYASARGQLDNALNLTNQAIGLCESSSPDNPCYYFKKYKAEIILKQNNPAEALLLLNEIQNDFDAVEDKREYAKFIYLKGLAESKNNQLDAALAYFQEALINFINAFEDADPEVIPAKNLWTREIWLMEVFREKANVFFEKYRLNGDESNLNLARENYQASVDVIQFIKQGYDGTESKLVSGSYTHPFFEDLIAANLVSAGNVGNNNFKEQSFETSQKANAYVLREMVAQEDAVIAAGIPDSLIDQINQIQKEINFQESLVAGLSVDSVSEESARLFDLKKELGERKESIRANYPLYDQLEDEINITSVNELQSNLDARTLVVKYFLGEKDCFIFSFTQDSFLVEQKPIPSLFNSWIKNFRRSLTDLDFVNDSTTIAEARFVNSSHELYQFLLDSTLDHYNDSTLIRLRIIPDGSLHTIPFQAFLKNATTSWDEQENYLVNDYSISYAFYAGMIVDEEEQEDWNNNFVSFGLEFDKYTLEYLDQLSKDSIENSTINEIVRGGKLTNLPFSDDEAKEIAEMMDGKAWLNEQATRENFLSEITQADFIHIATHSIVDYDQKNKSSLLFTKTKDSLDNFLHLHELYQMNLKAKMFVMSACNTALGPYRISEGLNSLARAVFYSGVPSVVASLWSVSDESSKKIMLEYYRFLKEGHTKDRAMQLAQLEYLSNDKLSSPAFRKPVYWAAWTVIGDQSAYKEHSSLPSIWRYVILSVFAFLSYFAFRKRRNRN